MEQRPIDLEQAITEFAAHMRRHGYRNSFTLSLPTKPDFTGNLNDCLYRCLASDIGLDCPELFDLRTKAPYNPDIQCRFSVGFDKVEGFQISGMKVMQLKTGLEHVYRLKNNRELLGSQTLAGLFPKPKAWDILKKLKFRR